MSVNILDTTDYAKAERLDLPTFDVLADYSSFVAEKPKFGTAFARADDSRNTLRSPIKPQSKAQRDRVLRNKLSRYLMKESSLVGLRNCGVSLIHSAQDTKIRIVKKKTEPAICKAHFTNLQTCSSKACPDCARTSAETTAKELETAIEQWVSKGGTVYFGTLTMRSKAANTPNFYNRQSNFEKTPFYKDMKEHIRNARKAALDNGFKLSAASENVLKMTYFEKWVAAAAPKEDSHTTWDLNLRWDALRDAASRVFSNGGSWANDKKRFGIVGHFYQTELRITPTKRKNETNWRKTKNNLHLHYVLFVETRLSDADQKWLTKNTEKRWIRAVKAKGYDAISSGQDLRWFDARSEDAFERIAHYLTKEIFSITSSVNGRKKGADGEYSYDVWQALKDATAGDTLALNWWRNFEQAQKRRWRTVWSSGFRDMLNVAELISEKTAEEEDLYVTQDLVCLPVASWSILNSKPESIPMLLNLAENSSDPLTAVTEWLGILGVEFFLPEASTPVVEDCVTIDVVTGEVFEPTLL